MSLPPAVAAVRLAVRRDLAELTGLADLTDPGDLRVLVGCSGGADSLALLAATVFEVSSCSGAVVGVTVDHGLQEGSSSHADKVVAQMATLGASETLAVRVEVDPEGRGVEAAAREARYAELEQVAIRVAADSVLLGHTLDDQAETVLLGLTRGSGGRSIAGMRPDFDVFRRPLLGITRQQTEAACAAEGIEFWEDPHNSDPRFTRSRIRHQVLPVLEAQLGPGVATALARTAQSLRPDMDALDELAEELLEEAWSLAGIDVPCLEQRHEAIATRVLRLAAVEAGAPPSELFRVHVQALHALVEGRMRGEVQLPGHVTAYLDEVHLRFRPTAVES